MDKTGLFAFVIAFMALGLAVSTEDIVGETVFEIITNNTDIGYPNGTGERLYNTIYYTNSSPVAIMLKAHAIGVNQDMDFNLSINGTVVQDVDHRTAVGAGIHEHESIYTIIPRGSSYSVKNSTDITQMEWREYPILSGRNGTVSYSPVTNNYIGGNWSIDFNSSNWYPDSRQFGVTYWNNQSKPMIIDIIAGNLTSVTTMNYSLSVNNTETQKLISTTAGMRFTTIYQFIPQYSSYNITNTSSVAQTYITWLEHNLTFTPGIVNNYYNTTSGGGGISFNGSAVDLNGSSFYNGSQQAGTFNHSNLTNLNWESSGHTSDNSKVNKTGDILNLTGNTRLNMSNNGNITGSYDTWDHPAGLSFTFFTSNRFQDKTTGWQYLSHPERTGGTIVWQDETYSYYTFPANNLTPIAQFSIQADGVRVSNSAGSGNAFACFDSTGKLYRSVSACA